MCWKDEVGDVSAVPLQLQERARETKVLQAIKCTQFPLLLCGTISFIPMRGANVCWEISANAVPTLPRARALTCPASRLRRKMLPEQGIEADHLSKARLKELNNEQRIKPLLHLSFQLSSATPSSLHQFLFCCASLSDGKRTNALSHLRRLKKG